MEIKKKGIYFSIDALFATILLIGGLATLKVLYIAPNYITTDYLSRDVSNVIATINVQDVDLPYLTKSMENGTIENNNVSFMEKLGELWSQSQDYELRRILEEFHQKYLPQRDFSVYFGGILAYNTTYEPETNLIASKRMVSGITANRSQTGFIAKAIASKTVKNTTLIVMGDVISSSVKKPNGGNNGNNVEVTYTIDVPSNAEISDAYWFIEAAWTGTKFKAYVNDVYIPGSDATGDKLLIDLKDYFHTGKNYGKIVYRAGSSGLEGGDDGASHIVVNYQTNRTNTISDYTHFFFAGVKSDCSIRYKKPIFVMNKMNQMIVNLNLNATNSTLTINFDGNDYFISKKNVINNSVIWNESEIVSTLTNFGLNYSNFTGKYIWIDIDIDSYHSKEESGDVRELYNSSFVYTSQEAQTNVYGYIDITKILDDYSYSDSQYSDFYRNVVWNFNKFNSSIPLFLDGQFAWLYYTGTTPSQIVKANSYTLYSSPPSSLIHEFARFGYNGDYVGNDKNNFSLAFGNGYGINPFRSLVAFTFLIKNLVPYDNTFDSKEDALNDAEQRLNTTLGNNVNALQIETKALGVGRVPSLWGPLLVEVRSWR